MFATTATEAEAASAAVMLAPVRSAPLVVPPEVGVVVDVVAEVMLLARRAVLAPPAVSVAAESRRR